MPVTSTGDIAFNIAGVQILIDQDTFAPLQLDITFARSLDGVPNGVVRCVMDQAQIATFLGAAPATGLTRGEDLIAGLSQWAVDEGHITGTMSA